MALPPATPAWAMLFGCAAAVVLPRAVAAGIGFNPVHPTLAGRVALLAVLPGMMAALGAPGGLFAVGGAGVTADWAPSLLDILVGRVPGGAGENAVLALTLGGAFLARRQRMGWHVPAAFFAGAAGPAALGALGGADHAARPALLGGGVVLYALIIAPDPEFAPATARGRLAFGAGCGVLTWVLRRFGDQPEGAAAYATALMSLVVPLIDGWRPRGAADAGELRRGGERALVVDDEAPRAEEPLAVVGQVDAVDRDLADDRRGMDKEVVPEVDPDV
jgi:electron transport complex protein RnfD